MAGLIPMNKNQLFLLFASLLLATITDLPNRAWAQVKIGNNYTTIGAASNLEVEAANSKKVIVNKTDGSVIIETTPVSTSASDLLLGVDGTGKVVTVDRTTIVNSVTASGSVGVAPYLRVEGNSSSSSGSPTVLTTPKNLSVTFTNLITYNGPNGTFTIPSDGMYYYSMSVSAPDGAGTTTNDVCLLILKGAVVLDRNCGRSSSAAGGTAIASGFYKFVSGDIVQLQYSTASNTPKVVPYDVTINIYKISD